MAKTTRHRNTRNQLASERGSEKPICLLKLPKDLNNLSFEQFERWCYWLADTRPLRGKRGLTQLRSRLAKQMRLAHQALLKPNGSRDRFEQVLTNGAIKIHIIDAALSIKIWGDDDVRYFLPNEISKRTGVPRRK